MMSDCLYACINNGSMRCRPNLMWGSLEWLLKRSKAEFVFSETDLVGESLFLNARIDEELVPSEVTYRVFVNIGRYRIVRRLL